MFARIRVDLGVRARQHPGAGTGGDGTAGQELRVGHWRGQQGDPTRRSRWGETIGENLLILEGLKPGERIVVEGLQKVREGAPVQPMTAAQMAEAAAEAAKHAEASHAKEGASEHGKE